ncbi:hypothetical protein MIR68_003221 [Amoeboaphelidium protococcarum]|nr:hypothetical protein MIR68_003221 [Amoeboaphelidium protococcarum]
MPFVKLVKTKAYFKRYQVKYRRRRAGKTDYYARKRLIAQDKNKYNSPKYRFVVRITSSQVICQVVYSKIQGDICLASAYSKELRDFGINVGLKNWSAAYATGLLCARRLLTKMNLADKYKGIEEPNGEYQEVEPLEDDVRPFKCYLDVGLKRTTTGAKVFGAMKGASDGGLYIPHSEKRFPGYDPSSKELDSEVLREYIYGGHIANYMRELEEDDEELYKRVFSQYLEQDLTADDIEDMYSEAHQKIRETPFLEKKKRSDEELKKIIEESKKKRKTRMNLKQRKDRVRQKKEAHLRALGIAQ